MVGDKLNIFLSRFEDKNLECERGCDQFDDALSLRTLGIKFKMSEKFLKNHFIGGAYLLYRGNICKKYYYNKW